MIKNNFIFGFLLLVFIVSGCGQQTSISSSNNQQVTGSVSIRGNIYSGTINKSAIKTNGLKVMASSESPIPDYRIVAVGTVDKKNYFAEAKTDSLGNFVISNLPSGESFYLELVNSNNKLVAPVSFGSSGSSVLMAVSPDATSVNINLGKIIYEDDKGCATVNSELSDFIIDRNSTAKQKSGELFIPVGAGNLGRGTGEAYLSDQTQLKNKVDEDNDGLPDVVDIDDNGNGLVDGLDPNPRLSDMLEVQITGISNTNSFSNLAESYEQYPTYTNEALNTNLINIGTDSVIAIEIPMAQGVSPDLFSDVRIVEGPSWIESALVSFADLSGYPSDHTLWKSVDYKLYKSTDRWTVWVHPTGIPTAGDVLKFQVTNASTGAKEYFISTITYVFNDIPRLVGYSYSDLGNIVVKEGATNLDYSVYSSNGNAFSYKGDTVTFTFIESKDDAGNYITGMDHYLDGIVYVRADSSNFSGGSLRIYPTAESNGTFGTVYTYTFTPTTDAFSYFKVDIKSQAPTSGGGNASQLINFKKIL